MHHAIKVNSKHMFCVLIYPKKVKNRRKSLIAGAVKNGDLFDTRV